MANEPVWLTADLLVEFNDLTVSQTGEPHVLRDLAGLESALARPVNHWHYGEADVVALSIALLLGIARNHPCDPSSGADILVTNRLRRLSVEVELPLIEHVVVAGDGVRGVR